MSEENENFPTPQWVRRRPLVLEAFHWTGHPLDTSTIVAWGNGTVKFHRESTFENCDGTDGVDPAHFMVSTLEGDLRADLGDWIVRGIRGEVWPVKPDIFDDTYEVTDDDV